MQKRVSIFALALLASGLSVNSSEAAPRPVNVNPFALTETNRWEYGFETRVDTPPLRWRATTLPRSMGEKKIVWYRLRFITRARPRIPLALMPGRITNTDRAYLNGQLIGSTGREGPGGGAFGRARLYYLPVELLKIASGKERDERQVNEFLIRVRGLPGESGIIAGPHRAGPLLLLRDRARLESLPAVFLAALLLAAALISALGLFAPGTRILLSLPALWGALFVGLAGDSSFQLFFSFHALKRLEFISLCCILAFLVPAVFQAPALSPRDTRRRYVWRSLAWLPAVLLLPAALVIAFSDDYGTWFLIRDRMIKPLALLACPALTLRLGLALFHRRSSDNFFSFAGLFLISCALFLNLRPDFQLSHGSGLLLFGSGLFLASVSRRGDSDSEPAILSEHRQANQSPRKIESDWVSLEITSPRSGPATAHAGEIRLAGGNYFALIQGSPPADPEEARLFSFAARQALQRIRAPFQSESTFPENWLRANLSEFRQFFGHIALPAHGDAEPAGISALFMGLLDARTGFLYYVNVGTPTVRYDRPEGARGELVGTPTENLRVHTHRMELGERLRIETREPGKPVGETPGPGSEIRRHGEPPKAEGPDDAARSRMRGALEEARRGKRADAIALYEELNLRYPESESIAQNLALLHIKDGNLWRAARLYEQCSRLNPALEKHIYQAALAHYRDKHHARAAALTERLILRNPNSLEGLLLLCELMRLLDHGDESNELLQRARTIAADDPRVIKMSKMISS